jgi:hypothetical protein
MSRVKDLMDAGFITEVLDAASIAELDKKSEKELIELGYITQVCFDGLDDTTEELPEVEVEPEGESEVEPEGEPENDPAVEEE